MSLTFRLVRKTMMYNTDLYHLVGCVESEWEREEKRFWGRRACGHASRVQVRDLHLRTYQLGRDWNSLIKDTEDCQLSFSLHHGTLRFRPNSPNSGVVETGYTAFISLLGVRRSVTSTVSIELFCIFCSLKCFSCLNPTNATLVRSRLIQLWLLWWPRKRRSSCTVRR